MITADDTWDERLREAVALASAASSIPESKRTPAARALPVLASEMSRQSAAIEEARGLHKGVHSCGGTWYNPGRGPGAAAATQGPCPTLRVLDDLKAPI